MKKRLTLKISISGVRGVVGDSLTPQLIARFALAFGSYQGRGKILVGQDARASGVMIKNAVFSGLLSVGCQPVDVGICPIPSFLVLTKDNSAIGGIVVTASHNPKDWNGLKFISGEGLYLNPSQIQEFLDIYHQGEFTLVPADKHKNLLFEKNPTDPHLKKLMNTLDVEGIRRKKIKVVIDCSNGAGAVLAPRFLEELGCETTLLNPIPDGALAHHPEPVPENLNALCRTVEESGADVGFVQDADADRLAIIDEKGTPLGEELTLALAVKYVLSKNPGSVVINLSTSRAIEDLAHDFNVPLIRTKIGEINVVDEILNTKATIGGEGNGGVILPAVHPCRDSFTAMGLTLEHMAATGKTISQLREKIPFYFMLKDQIPGSPEDAYQIIRKLKKKHTEAENISTLDGLKLNFADYWIHIRPSNTEPIIRILTEARSQRKAEEVLRRFKIEMSGL